MPAPNTGRIHKISFTFCSIQSSIEWVRLICIRESNLSESTDSNVNIFQTHITDTARIMLNQASDHSGT